MEITVRLDTDEMKQLNKGEKLEIYRFFNPVKLKLALSNVAGVLIVLSSYTVTSWSTPSALLLYTLKVLTSVPL